MPSKVSTHSSILNPDAMKPKLRFKGFDEEWESQLFSCIFEPLPNNSLSRAMLADNGTVRNIHYGDILIKYGEFVNTAVDSIPYIKDDSYCPPYKNILKCGDVVFTDAAEDNTVGKCCEIISSENDLLVAGLHTIPVRPNCIFNEKFLGYYLNSDAFHDQLIPYIQGTKVSSISRKALNSSFVKFPPSAKEQKNISNFLSSILKNRVFSFVFQN